MHMLEEVHKVTQFRNTRALVPAVRLIQK